MNIGNMKKSTPSTHPPPTSFSSLPYDLVLNILARISRSHRPILSLVSKSFQSLISSPELDATRALIGITEDCLYVCLDLNDNNTVPRWFELVPTPHRQKLLPIPNLLPYQNLEASTIVSVGSELYQIEGLVNEKRSTRVLILDFKSLQIADFPHIILPRVRRAADGKIYVIGNCNKRDNSEHWGNVYDPNTEIWKTLSPTTVDHLITQKSVVPVGRLVMGRKVYAMNGLKLNFKAYHDFKAYHANTGYGKDYCLAEIETNVWCEIHVSDFQLFWRHRKDDCWIRVEGLENMSSISCFTTKLVAVANSGGGRVTVWWKTKEHNDTTHKCTRDIWCAEISFQRQGDEELKGFIEWSKSVFSFTFDGMDYASNFFLHSVLVNH